MNTFDAREKKVCAAIVSCFALYLAAFHIISGMWGMPNTTAYRYVHLTGMVVLILMLKPLKIAEKHAWIRVLDYIFSAAALAILAYILSDINGFANRQGRLTQADIICGTVYLVVLLIATHRVTGMPMVLLALFFAGQNLMAQNLPGVLHGANVSYERLIDYIFMRTSGVIGVPVTAMANYVIYFMFFAAILQVSGAGEFFIDLALAVAGKSRGGPAKAAVISSALFGSLSGSAIANVASTGCVTIPLMKKTGYDKTFAGAVEAVASTGGQIMPPMMGAAAFIMAENLGVQYIYLALCAAIPAIFYFGSVYFMVDFRAGKLGLKGSTGELPQFKAVIRKGWPYITPLLYIVLLLCIGKSARYAAIHATILLLIISVISSEVKMDGKKMVKCFSRGVISMAGVTVTAGVAGIIIGGISVSGFGIKLASYIITISQGILPIALIFTAVVSIILGMGMSTTAVYVTVATIVASSLIKMGVTPMAAHMFCFYFGCVCTITPPVAMAAYTAAGISGASPAKTGVQAFILGLAAYVVPFCFIYRPALLLQGTAPQVIWDVVVVTVMLISAAAVCQRYMLTHLKKMEIVALLATAVLGFLPFKVMDIAAVVLFVLIYLGQRIRVKKEAAV